MKNPLLHPSRKYPSILGKRVYDHAWEIKFLDFMGREIFRLSPYILHGPNPKDNGLSEVEQVARETVKNNRTWLIKRCKISYLGVL